MIPAANVARPGEERERRAWARRRRGGRRRPARRAGRDRGHEHVARAARVLADDERAAGPDQPARGRPAEGVGERRLEVDVGDAADSVRAEEAGHRQPPATGMGMAQVGGVRRWRSVRRVIVTVTVTGRAGGHERRPRPGGPTLTRMSACPRRGRRRRGRRRAWSRAARRGLPSSRRPAIEIAVDRRPSSEAVGDRDQPQAHVERAGRRHRPQRR